MSANIDYDDLPKTLPSLPATVVLDAFANELRRVTASLKGWTLILKDENSSKEQRLAVSEAIERQINRMTALIDNVKTYLEKHDTDT